jgi:DNA (cytosine-5)-methyltransferase 1
MTTIGSLFSGVGGIELGLEKGIPGSKTIWQVEQDPFCQRVLAKNWPNAELFDDVNKVGKQNLSKVDIICGGFPCQGFSVSGHMQGLDHEKSNLWWQCHRIIRELRPSVVVLENTPALLVRGALDVLGSLAKIGYDAEWSTITASSVGAPHRRDRVFIVCYPTRGADQGRTAANADHGYAEDTIPAGRQTAPVHGAEDGEQFWRRNAPPPSLCRVDDGVPNRVERCKSYGNAVVPQIAEWIGRRIAKSELL